MQITPQPLHPFWTRYSLVVLRKALNRTSQHPSHVDIISEVNQSKDITLFISQLDANTWLFITKVRVRSGATSVLSEWTNSHLLADFETLKSRLHERNFLSIQVFGP